VAVPVAEVVAESVSVVPLHTGWLDVAVGAAGGLGSVSTKGPTGDEGQLLNVTKTLEYVPAVSPPIVIVPDAEAVNVTVVALPLFFTNETM
jgi:hypothetical protein